MTHWTAPLNNLFSLNSFDLKDLAKSVGANPEFFYTNQDLSKCDLRGQDLRGMNLSGTLISANQMDENTKIDIQYDPRFIFGSEYISFRIPLEFLAIIYGYADDSRYVYKAWAFKNLIEWSLLYSEQSDRLEMIEFIYNNLKFGELIDASRKPYKRVKIQVYKYLQERAFAWASETGRNLDGSIYLELLLIGMLKRKFRNIKSRDYSNIVPISMYASARDHYAELLQ